MTTHDQPLMDLLDLLPIPGASGREKLVADRIIEICSAVPGFKGRILQDKIGNLIIRFEGDTEKPHLMFAAHLDTIPLAVGARPVVRDGFVRNAAPDRSLGADCRAGCAILLQIVRHLAKNKRAYAPVTLAFFVQEENGVLGSQNLDLSLLGDTKPAMAFDFDTEGFDHVYTAGIGARRFHINITGWEAHTCLDPENGVSAAMILAHALSSLGHSGWDGIIEKPEGKGLANLGVLNGGEMTNCVMAGLHAYAEARSHDPRFLERIVAEWENAFTAAVKFVKNSRGEYGSVSFTPGPSYEAYALDKDSPLLRLTRAAFEQCAATPVFCTGNGGGDANRLIEHGIPCVALGMGVHGCHTPAEHLCISEFNKCCEVAIAALEA